MTDALLGVLEQYGYPIVFLAALLENVLLVGWFVPGQAVVFSAGVATRFAELGVGHVAALAAAGETIGNVISYWIGRVGGRSLLERQRERRGGSRVQLEEAEAFFERHGAVALLVGRPAWGIKNVLPAVAGMSGMPFWKATLLVGLSSLVYYPLLVAVAYGVGLTVEEASTLATWLGIGVTVLLVAAGFAVWKWQRSRNLGT